MLHGNVDCIKKGVLLFIKVASSKKLKNQKSDFFMNFMGLAALMIGLLTVTYLVPRRTKLLSRAKNLTQNVRSTYYLEGRKNPVVITTNQDYELHALLKRRNDSVVVNQKDLVYEWTTDHPEEVDLTLTPTENCTENMQPPCPEDMVIVRAQEIGDQTSTNVRVRVIDNSTGNELASTAFYVSLIEPEMYTTIRELYPDGGEMLGAGQKLQISWSDPSRAVDYYNLYYLYYENGEEVRSHVSSVDGEQTSYDWNIPSELRNKDVKVSIEARKDGYVVAVRTSSEYFYVRGSN